MLSGLIVRLFLALLACLAVVLAMTNLQLPVDSIFYSALQNSGHVLIFCFLTLVSLALLSGIETAKPQRRYVYVFSALMIIGLSIELIQRYIGRGFSASDQLLNLGGILAGFLAFESVTRLKGKQYGKGLLCGFATLLVLLAGFIKPIQVAVNYFQRPGPPVLADFEEPNALLRFFHFGTGDFAITKAPVEWEHNNTHVLRARTGNQHRVRIQLREPHADWSEYQWLDFEVFMAEKKHGTLLLLLRDRSNWRNEDGIDAYKHFIKLNPGLNQISVPLMGLNQRIGVMIDNTIQNKMLNIQNMQEVVFLLLAGEEFRTLFLDNVTLR